MPVIIGGKIIEDSYGNPLLNAGVPGNGTSAVQTLTTTGTPTGGTFKLRFDGFDTAAIAYNASAATVQAALRALPNIGSAGVNCAGGALPTGVTITFADVLAKLLVPVITVADNSLTGGSSPAPAIANTTPGVTAFGRGAGPGVLATDITNKKLYINSGTALEPAWIVAGTQT